MGEVDSGGSPERATPRVLICEDEAIVAADIRMTLRDLGYAVVGAVASAEKAVEMALVSRPDLVLMDVHTKGKMDGVEAARVIREQLEVPVVFLTAHADRETVSRARSAEPLGYVVKPFKDIDLRTAIEIALQRDATERKLRERERLLALEKERLSTLIANLSIGVLLEDEHAQVRHANGHLAHLLDQRELPLLGRSLAEALSTIASQLVDSAATERTLHALWRGRARREALLLRTASGRTIEVDYAPMGGAAYGGALWTFSDVSERERGRAQAEQMRELATTDELTLLLNRRGLLTLGPLQQQLAMREQRKLLTAYIDLDGMKRVNDTLGHHEGDALLRAAAIVLRKTFRASDVIARVGGDEFAVLAMVSESGDVDAIAERLQRNLAEHNLGRGEQAELALSTGYELSDPADRESIESLLARADRAMYAQKRANRRAAEP